MKIAGDLSRAWVSLKIVHHALGNPVQLPVKVQLTINLRTAKALGLNVPSSFLLRADEVIEQEVPCCDCSRPLLARNGHADSVAQCPLLGAKQKTFARIELFRF
jgi:hypothetical protein